MSPHGPIASKPKPKPITAADVREWFEDATEGDTHTKLHHLNLDAASTECVEIAVLSNLLQKLGGDGLKRWVEATNEARKAIAVLTETLPYLERMSCYGDRTPRLHALYTAAKHAEAVIGPPRSQGQRPFPVWHHWAHLLADPIHRALVAAGHKKASHRTVDGPLVAVLYYAIPDIVGDPSFEVAHDTIVDALEPPEKKTKRSRKNFSGVS